MSRTPQTRTETQQREHDRLQALRLGTPDAIRAWATKYNAPLINLEDDELLLITIHEARSELFTGRMRRASLDWLTENRARIITSHGGTP